MTGVPLPRFFGDKRSKISCANILYCSCESQQSPGVLLPVWILIFLCVGSGCETVLLHGALQQEQRFVLQVG